jgi:hypothetical protein
MVLPRRDVLRFQFVFGELPPDLPTMKPNNTGNLTVSYLVPYTRESFGMERLRSVVEKDHDDNIKQAHRAKNTAKRPEREGIARISIDSMRDWFKHVEVSDFMDAVNSAVDTNTTQVFTTKDCRVRVTAQWNDAVIL